jgi:polyphosphate kinase
VPEQRLSQDVVLLNREVSRLDYNRRVLAKAEDASLPLLERLRFLTYCAHNLDEFFMVRAGATRDRIDAGLTDVTPDGLTPSQQMDLIRKRARALLGDMYRCVNDGLLPALEKEDIRLVSFRNLPPEDRERLSAHFRSTIAPVLTPLAIDPGHPFPYIANRALNIGLLVESERSGEHVVLMKVPAVLERFIPIGPRRFLPIGSLIVAHLPEFFPTLRVKSASLFRVIRNSELSIDEEEVRDLREAMEAELRRRDRKQVVCLEIDERAEPALVDVLIAGTKTKREDVYPAAGFIKLDDLAQICDQVHAPELSYPPFNPRLPQRLASQSDIFTVIREGDVLLHRPYDSFTAVVELIHAAAHDPAVLAIKQTLYQTSEHSPIVDQLVAAALNGKQVTVIIELQTRFEERRNLSLARRLQDAGAQVVYGLVGLETHAKVCLVVRSEESGLAGYVHLSTGNYDPGKARAYTDFDLLTSSAPIAADATQLLNILTGFTAVTVSDLVEGARELPRWQHFAIAPFEYQRWLVDSIHREARHALDGKPARITAKLNSLVDPTIIETLYQAAAAGVQVDLIVRSICCLVPRDNIRVISIVDRFLEHDRIVRFENGGSPETYLCSGDWMPRNFSRRIELAFPVIDPQLRRRVDRILEMALSMPTSTWELGRDGSWRRRAANGPTLQESLIALTRTQSVRLDDYDEALDEPEKFRRRARRRRPTLASTEH